jgi:hypothetical protein
MSDLRSKRPSHAELLRLARSPDPREQAAVVKYLEELAADLDALEVFAVLVLVDTPDVLG